MAESRTTQSWATTQSFGRMSTWSQGLSGVRSMKLSKDERQTLHLKRELEVTGEMTGELDKLFEEMGRSTTVVRVGARHHVRVAAGLLRTVEVRLPKPQSEAKSAFAVTLTCRLNEEEHLVENMEDQALAATLLPPQKFSIGVCDTARQAADSGPYRETRGPALSHSVTFTTEFSSFFINLEAPKDCHVLLGSKASAKEASLASGTLSKGVGLIRPPPGAAGEDSDESDGGGKMMSPRPTGAMRKLQKKVKQHKKTKFVERRSRKTLLYQKPAAASNPLSVRRIDAAPAKKKGVSFGELVFPEGRPCREPHQVEYAQQKVLALWLGATSRFAAKRIRPRRPWAKKLSNEFPQKLTQYLWRTRQEQSMLTSLAIAGAFSFFLKRQRQLHLMRSRLALRQLAWYKALFAASRFLVFAVFMMRGRQQARDRRKGVPVTTSGRRLSMRRRSSDAEMFFQDMNPLNLVRTYLHKPGGRSRSKTPGREEGPAGSLAQRKMRSVRALPDADAQNSLEHRLAKQGFTLRPRQEQAVRSGSKSRHASRSPREWLLQQNLLGAKGIAQRVGRSTQRAPQVTDFAEDENLERAIAMQEVTQAAVMMTIRPRELAAAVGKQATVELMGVESFNNFYTQAVQRAADELLRQRAKEANELMAQDKVVKVQFIKRYRLRFFDEELPELPWLALQQSLMLVIRGKAMFLNTSELNQYEAKLKNVNEERRAAAYRRGLLAPLEAILWSHPVLVSLSMKMQRAMARGEGAFSWKTALFEGRVEKCSARDLEGHQFLISGGTEGRLLRRSVDVGGPFTVSPTFHHEEVPPASRESFAATTTSGGAFWRPFGQSEEKAATAFRLDDASQVIPVRPEPPQERLEDARRARRARTAAEVANRFGDRTEQMVADGEARSQNRFRSWALASDVPAEARAWKEKMLPFFDDFASTCSSLRKMRATYSEGFRAASVANREVQDCLPSCRTDHSFAQDEEEEQETPRKAPQTAEEVGNWLARHDVLQTVKSDDGMTPSCACGWTSGFRQEPMTMDEVLRVRILERSNAAFARHARPAKTAR